MRALLFFTLALLLTSIAMAQNTGKRQVLIFGSSKNQQVMAQSTLLEKDRAGLKERDMIVTILPEKSPLYKRFGVSASEVFLILLVGKDGTEKFRSKELTPAQELFALVDAMPMRKQETQRGNRQAD
jgi:hypothetical protein